MITCIGKTRTAISAARRDILQELACTAKVVHTNVDKNSTKSSKSFKSASFAAIQKSMKSMGKAMPQLGELADFDNELFDEQLHAQLGTVDVKMPGRGCTHKKLR